MYFIVLDLEWNQKHQMRPDVRGISEIIELGAVRLDRDKRPAGVFSAVVHPAVYNDIHPYVGKLVHLDQDALSEGAPFPQVMGQFDAFCGEGAVYLTWGTDDIMVLMQNFAYYGMDMNRPIRSINLQQLFSQQFETDGRSQRSLSATIEMLDIEKKWDFHSALSDARYAAEIFMRLDTSKLDISFPEMPRYKGISARKKIRFRTNMGRQLQCVCPVCAERSGDIQDYFGISSRRMIVIAFCRQHGYFKTVCEMPRTAQRRGRPGDKKAK
ncbi:MAG: exonuclease domain-containing protein [Christensenellales bacterium]